MTQWTPDEKTRDRIIVENPEKPYGFPMGLTQKEPIACATGSSRYDSVGLTNGLDDCPGYLNDYHWRGSDCGPAS